MNIINHLTIRVAWHDNYWNGAICQRPSKNPFCTALDRIREERDDEAEDKIAGKGFWEIDPSQLPPCKAEAGAFMNEHEWSRLLIHPYQNNPKAKPTHGHLLPTTITVPPYSTFAVPFELMLKENQEDIQNSLPEQLPMDMESPFPTPWVFGRERQVALLDSFFGKFTEGKSLVLFYTKEGHPIGDDINRLVVGIGLIENIGKLLFYETNQSTKPYPPWDRIITHSIRPDGVNGLLLPYHDYLKPTGDIEEDQHRRQLLNEIAIPASQAHIKNFSYAAQVASPDVVLSTLTQLLASIRKIRNHGIIKGQWDEREDWVNSQIATAWRDRGAFPGVGAVLEALGMRLGTSLFLELLLNNQISSEENPWPKIDSILRGETEPPKQAYKKDIQSVSLTWTNLSEERRSVLELLSRFDLTISQAKRCFDSNLRNSANRQNVTDGQIIGNPYILCETDLGEPDDGPVTMGVFDRGLLPDSTISAKFPVPDPSNIGSINDPRRIRAAIVSVLQQVANEGDSLLSQKEVLSRLQQLSLSKNIMVGEDWIETNKQFLSGVIELVDVLVDPEKGKIIRAVQLLEYKKREDDLRKILLARAKKTLPSLGVDWKNYLIESIHDTGGLLDESSAIHKQALEEQADALEKISSRKLAVLVGKAGTGKTSVLGALLKSESLVKEGVLLLAPTGKARVRLSKAAQTEAYTIAQFLYQNDRFDGVRQRPLFDSDKTHRKQKTVIIDECSMLTMDDLYAVLKALDLAHVQRIILVGDPNQLPPIGVGRPFADFVGYLENCVDFQNQEISGLTDALSRLTVELRSREGASSDTLRLASWFTREPQPVDGDRVLSELELGSSFNDLEIKYWSNSEELFVKLLESLKSNLGIKDKGDYIGLDQALGSIQNGKRNYSLPDGVANFQILSPVRMEVHGVYGINRWIQQEFRGGLIKRAKRTHGLLLGDEEIVFGDKVINLKNHRRSGYDREIKEKVYEYLANGEIGIMVGAIGKFGNVLFEGRPNHTFGFSGSDFSKGAVALELAYALTIHKAQGSEFKYVFVVMPKQTRLLSRELLYTALTRARQKLILLVEGDDPTFLYEHSRSESSDTANRNTNLFVGAIREEQETPPYSSHLIHKTLKGHMVRSKSELVIADILFENGIEYTYERPLEGITDQKKLRPDFTFIDPSGDIIIWEHLGMLAREDYRKGWEWKQQWYSQNNFHIGENLFTTQDDPIGGLDSTKVKEIALKIKNII